MKRLSTENRKKLKFFMEQQENMIGTVVFFSIISYLILIAITKNFIVLLSGYTIFYVLYMKLYKHIYFKLFGNDCK